MSDERWISANEAAEILRMTPRQVNRYGNAGKLQTRRAGRRVLYALADVVALADELQVNVRPNPQPSPLAKVEELGDYLRQLADAQRSVEAQLQQIREAEQRRLPPPPGPTKEELQSWLREVIAEQDARRSRVSWTAIAAVALMVIALAVILWAVLIR